jgi:hypothetical protein
MKQPTNRQVQAYKELKENNQLGTIGKFQVTANELYIHHTKDSKNYITAILKDGLITQHINSKED